MGAIENAVQAVEANNTLTPLQKRAQIAQIRADAVNSFLTGHLPFVWSAGVWVVTVTQAVVGSMGGGYAVSVWVDVTKSGVEVPLFLPLIFVNPPALVTDPAGTITRTTTLPSYQGGATITHTLREDAVAAFKAALLATLIDLVGA